MKKIRPEVYDIGHTRQALLSRRLAQLHQLFPSRAGPLRSSADQPIDSRALRRESDPLSETASERLISDLFRFGTTEGEKEWLSGS